MRGNAASRRLFPCTQDMGRWLGMLCILRAISPARATDGYYDPSFGSGGRHSFALSAGSDSSDGGQRLRTGQWHFAGRRTVHWDRRVPRVVSRRRHDFNHNYGRAGPAGFRMAFPASSQIVWRTWLCCRMDASCSWVTPSRGRLLRRHRAGRQHRSGPQRKRRGWTTCGVPNNETAYAVALQTDGKILVAGAVLVPSTARHGRSALPAGLERS
jgi:hypothetical protein